MAGQDEYDLDFKGGAGEDLEFDFEDDFEMDGEFGDDEDRSVVSQVVTGVKEGAFSHLTEVDNLKHTIVSVLPADMQSDAGAVEELYSSSRDEVRKAARKIKPVLEESTSAVKDVLPEGRILSMVEKLEKTLGLNQEKVEAESRQEQQKNAVDSALNGMFKDMNTFNLRTKVEQDLKDTVDRSITMDHHRDMMKVLLTSQRAVSDVQRYTIDFTSRYQRKSLELKYEQVYLTKRLVETATKDSKVRTRQLESIVKNTALPEYAKLQLGERIGETGRDALISKGRDALFGDTGPFGASGPFGDFIRQAKDVSANVIRNTAELVADIADKVTGVADGYDSAASSGMGSSTSNVSKLATDGVLGMLSEAIAGRIAGVLDTDDTGIAKTYRKGSNWLNTLPARLKEMFSENDDDSEFKTLLKNFAVELAEVTDGDNQKTHDAVANAVVRKDYSLDHRMYTTVTDIIPGYLSRILQEAQGARLGEVPERVVYDLTRNTFSTEKGIQKSIDNVFNKSTTRDTFRDGIDEYLDANDAQKLSPKERKKAVEFLKSAFASSMATGRGIHSVEALLASPYVINILAEDKDLDGIVNKVFGGDQGTDTIYTTIKAGTKVSKQLGSFSDMIPKLISAYGFEAVMESGVVDFKNGMYTVNEKRLGDLLYGYDGDGNKQVNADDINPPDATGSKASSGSSRSQGAARPSALEEDLLHGLEVINLSVENNTEVISDNLMSVSELITDCCDNMVQGQPTSSNATLDDVVEAVNSVDDTLFTNLDGVYEELYSTSATLAVSLTPLSKLEEILEELKDINDSTAVIREISLNPDIIHEDANLNKMGYLDAVRERGRRFFRRARGRTTPHEKRSPFARVTERDQLDGKEIWYKGKRISVEKLDEMMEKFGDASKPLMEKSLGEVISGTMKGASNIITGVGTAGLGLIGGGIGVAERGLNGAKGFYDSNKDGIKGFASSAGKGAKDVMSGILNSSLLLGGSVIGLVGKGIEGMKSVIPAAWSSIIDGLGWVKDQVKDFMRTGPCDIYAAGIEEPVLLKILMERGNYADKNTGKPITSPDDIKGPVIDGNGDIVMTQSMIDAGVFDSKGNDITSKLGGVRHTFGLKKGSMSGGFTWVKDKLMSVGSFVGNLWSSITSFGGTSIEHFETLLELESTQTRTQLEIAGMLSRKFNFKWNDQDGDGMRDGGWRSVLSKRKAEESKDDMKKEREKAKVSQGKGLTALLEAMGVAKSLLTPDFLKNLDPSQILAGAAAGNAASRNKPQSDSKDEKKKSRGKGKHKGKGGGGESGTDESSPVSDFFSSFMGNATGNLFGDAAGQVLESDKAKSMFNKFFGKSSKGPLSGEQKELYKKFRKQGMTPTQAKEAAKSNNAQTLLELFGEATGFNGGAEKAGKAASSAKKKVERAATAAKKKWDESAPMPSMSREAYRKRREQSTNDFLHKTLGHEEYLRTRQQTLTTEGLQRSEQLRKFLLKTAEQEVEVDAKRYMERGMSKEEALNKATEKADKKLKMEYTRFARDPSEKNTRKLMKRASRHYNAATRKGRFMGNTRALLGGGMKAASMAAFAPIYGAGKVAGAVLPTAAKATGSVAKYGASVVGRTASVAGSAVGMLGRGAIGMAGLATGGIEAAAGMLMPLLSNPVTGIPIAIIAALGAGIYFKDEIKEGFDIAVEMGSSTISDSTAWLSRANSEVGHWVNDLGVSIGEGVAKFTNYVGKMADDTWDWISKTGVNLKDDAFGLKDDVAKYTKNAFGHMTDWFTAAITGETVTSSDEDSERFVERISDEIVDKTGKIQTRVKDKLTASQKKILKQENGYDDRGWVTKTYNFLSGHSSYMGYDLTSAQQSIMQNYGTLETLRFQHYGLIPGSIDQMAPVREFEDLLLKKKAYKIHPVTKAIAFVGSKVSVKSLMKLMDRKVDNIEQKKIIEQWMRRRFIPVFEMTLNSMIVAGMGLNLGAMKSIKGAQGVAFLNEYANEFKKIDRDNLRAHGSGIFQDITNPFKLSQTGTLFSYNDAIMKGLVYEDVYNRILSRRGQFINGDRANKDGEDNLFDSTLIADIEKGDLTDAQLKLLGVGKSAVEKRRASIERQLVASGTLDDLTENIESLTTAKGRSRTAELETSTRMGAIDAAINDKMSKIKPRGNVVTAKGKIILGGVSDERAVNYGEGNGFTVKGKMIPIVWSYFTAMCTEYQAVKGAQIKILSLYRSVTIQQKLFDAGKAAETPAKSPFTIGAAIQIPQNMATNLDAMGLLSKYGFTRPIGGEMGTLEPMAIQANIDKVMAMDDPAIYITKVFASALGKAGGGWGAPNSGWTADLGNRNVHFQTLVAKLSGGKRIDPKEPQRIAMDGALSTPAKKDGNSFIMDNIFSIVGALKGSKQAKENLAAKMEGREANNVSDKPASLVKESGGFSEIKPPVGPTLKAAGKGEKTVNVNTPMGPTQVGEKTVNVNTPMGPTQVNVIDDKVKGGKMITTASGIVIGAIPKAVSATETVRIIKSATETPEAITEQVKDLSTTGPRRGLSVPVEAVTSSTSRATGLYNPMPRVTARRTGGEPVATGGRYPTTKVYTSPEYPNGHVYGVTADTLSQGANGYVDSAVSASGAVMNGHPGGTGNSFNAQPIDPTSDKAKSAADRLLAKSREKIIAKYPSRHRNKVRSVLERLDAASVAEGINPYAARNMGAIESKMGITTNKNSPKAAQGVFQFYGSAWKEALVNRKLMPKKYLKTKYRNLPEKYKRLMDKRKQDHTGDMHIKNGVSFIKSTWGQVKKSANLTKAQMAKHKTVAMYAGHFLGANAAGRILKAYIKNPNTRLSAGLLGYKQNQYDQAVRTNGDIFLGDRTVGSLIANLKGRLKGRRTLRGYADSTEWESDLAAQMKEEAEDKFNETTPVSLEGKRMMSEAKVALSQGNVERATELIDAASTAGGGPTLSAAKDKHRLNAPVASKRGRDVGKQGPTKVLAAKRNAPERPSGDSLETIAGRITAEMAPNTNAVIGNTEVTTVRDPTTEGVISKTTVNEKTPQDTPGILNIAEATREGTNVAQTQVQLLNQILEAINSNGGATGGKGGDGKHSEAYNRGGAKTGLRTEKPFTTVNSHRKDDVQHDASKSIAFPISNNSIKGE
jgi:hypothetical protein